MTPVSYPFALTVPLMLGGRRLCFTFFNCMIIALFGLLRVGEHTNTHVCYPSLLETNKYANISMH